MASKKDSDVEMKDKNQKDKDKKSEDKAKSSEEKKVEEKKKDEPKLSPRDQTLKGVLILVVYAISSSMQHTFFFDGVDIREFIKSISEESKLDRRQLARVAHSQLLLRKRVNADILTSIAKQYHPEAIQWITLIEVGFSAIMHLFSLLVQLGQSHEG
jgi:hypothetical protein